MDAVGALQVCPGLLGSLQVGYRAAPVGQPRCPGQAVGGQDTRRAAAEDPEGRKGVCGVRVRVPCREAGLCSREEGRRGAVGGAAWRGLAPGRRGVGHGEDRHVDNNIGYG